MKFATAISVLAVAGSALASALPSTAGLEKRDPDCIAPLLCCGTLTTPLDPTVDPILALLGVNAAEVVGSIGLLCHAYDDECTSEPQCCTEANLLGGTVALGCSALDDHHH
ncbi:hydrophobin family protein [Aspergillus mulundensis]|uniref:Hydrophobin n=1 Tax=Aspergillus mulundensis TaxID=1810919 RepID=A0A3D8RKW7_9EURO|nr:Uncharacterized protein DSM5745_07262 [Aspergillus mulundensis]RDW74600.1 Uncharacterized protein DSM5745_07262 [Aspergillus mulundensis]